MKIISISEHWLKSSLRIVLYTGTERRWWSFELPSFTRKIISFNITKSIFNELYRHFSFLFCFVLLFFFNFHLQIQSKIKLATVTFQLFASTTHLFVIIFLWLVFSCVYPKRVWVVSVFLCFYVFLFVFVCTCQWNRLFLKLWYQSPDRWMRID